jgi:hypothetical protein
MDNLINSFENISFNNTCTMCFCENSDHLEIVANNTAARVCKSCFESCKSSSCSVKACYSCDRIFFDNATDNRSFECELCSTNIEDTYDEIWTQCIGCNQFFQKHNDSESICSTTCLQSMLNKNNLCQI